MLCIVVRIVVLHHLVLLGSATAWHGNQDNLCLVCMPHGLIDCCVLLLTCWLIGIVGNGVLEWW
jgi:hypothetical protein